MSHDSGPLAKFGGTVRLFPLPNLVFFPHAVQPLHIFEQRYRQLMQDALADDRLITMALLKPNWEETYHLCPAIQATVCIGRIHQEVRLPDGRFNLVLEGLARARLIEEIETDRLYRMARVELLDDIAMSSGPSEQNLRQELAERACRFFDGHPVTLHQLQQIIKSQLSLGALTDIFAFTLPLPWEAKQELLEECDVERRARALLGHLAQQRRGFPPLFSDN